MSNSDLKWFAGASTIARMHTNNLQEVVSGIGCLIASDTSSGALQEQGSVASLLFSISEQLETINGLLEIGNDANDWLRNPELRQKLRVMG